MKKIRLGVVGLGHRGRLMFKLAAEGFDSVVPAAACDILPHNWYEKQWLIDDALSNIFPETKFYESYDQMLEEANLDAVIVETGADIHAEFCAKALKKILMCFLIFLMLLIFRKRRICGKHLLTQMQLSRQVLILMNRNLPFYLMIFIRKDFLVSRIVWKRNIFTGVCQKVKKVSI